MKRPPAVPFGILKWMLPPLLAYVAMWADLRARLINVEDQLESIRTTYITRSEVVLMRQSADELHQALGQRLTALETKTDQRR